MTPSPRPIPVAAEDTPGLRGLLVYIRALATDCRSSGEAHAAQIVDGLGDVIEARLAVLARGPDPAAERAALAAGTHTPAVDDFGNQYLAALAGPASPSATLDAERLARAMQAATGVKWPSLWITDDFAWVARQVAANYRREPA